MRRGYCASQATRASFRLPGGGAFGSTAQPASRAQITIPIWRWAAGDCFASLAMTATGLSLRGAERRSNLPPVRLDRVEVLRRGRRLAEFDLLDRGNQLLVGRGGAADLASLLDDDAIDEVDLG